MATEAEIIKMIEETPADALYKTTALISNHKTDSGKRYCDIVAEYLIGHPDHFKSVKVIRREKSYHTPSHGPLKEDDIAIIHEKTRKEEWIARSLVSSEIDYQDFVGTFIDYQIPVKNVRSDRAGKVDLLSYNKAQNAFYLIEFKREDNTEPLLRAILEAYTYWLQIDREQLCKDFFGFSATSGTDRSWDELRNADVRPAVLIFENSRQKTEAENSDSVVRFADTLGVRLFLLSTLDNPRPENNPEFRVIKTHVPGRQPVWI